MVRLTKAQRKRLLRSIISKATKLYTQTGGPGEGASTDMTMKDFDAIRKICGRSLKRLG